MLKVESAVGEFVAALTDGRLSPWAKRLDGAGRTAAMRDLVLKLGKRYAAASFANYEIYDQPKQSPVIARLLRFAEKMPEHLSSGSGLILMGDPGTGKDHLVAALLKLAVAKHGLTAGWWDGLALFEEARHAIQTDGERRLIQQLEAPQILALSDPQPPKGDFSDYQVRLIRDVVDRRYRRGLSTWITSNVDAEEDAEALLTAPLLDRLREGSVQVVCDWESYRQRRRPSV